MEHCGAKRNYKYKTLFVENIENGLSDILSADATTDKFWYILRQDGTLAGCVGSREYSQICETGRMAIKKDFLFIHAGEGEKQTAINLFTAYTKIRKLPVLDKNGKLLYEYIRSMESYYEDLDIVCGINVEDQRKEKIVVSLTSFGRRLDTVHIVIKSIMNQILKADAIVLYIAKEDSLKRIQQEEELIRAGLRIVRNVRDLKPHKKYFYAMREFTQCLIVTIDDDAIYDDRLLRDLYEKHIEYPEAVICRRGHRMTKKDGRVACYDMWEGCVQSVVPEKGICATGVGGILYPCGAYREKFLDEKGIRETALFGDDLWLNVVELMEGIAVYAIGEIPAKVIEGTQEEALYMKNAENKRNDEYLNSLQSYFDINLADLF